MKQIIQTQKIFNGVRMYYTVYRTVKRYFKNNRWYSEPEFRLIIEFNDHKKKYIHREALVLTMWDIDPRNYGKEVYDLCALYSDIELTKMFSKWLENEFENIEPKLDFK